MYKMSNVAVPSIRNDQYTAASGGYGHGGGCCYGGGGGHCCCGDSGGGFDLDELDLATLGALAALAGIAIYLADRLRNAKRKKRGKSMFLRIC